MNPTPQEEFLALSILKNSPNKKELFMEFIESLKDVKEIIGIIDYTTHVIKQLSEEQEREVRDLSNAVHDSTNVIGGKKTKTPKKVVIDHVRIMKMYFKNCIPEDSSKNSQKFFNTYLECLVKCKDDIIDSTWAANFGHNDYLKQLLLYKETL